MVVVVIICVNADISVLYAKNNLQPYNQGVKLCTEKDILTIRTETATN